MKKLVKSKKEVRKFVTRLKVGDTVMVLSGGNSKRDRTLKGQTGKILKFLPKTERVIVEGVNMIKRHKRARNAQESSGIIQKEGSIHISNVMYYSADLKRPIALKVKTLEDGKRVRGFVDPSSKAFQQVDARKE